ncbi:DNA damage-inducible protein D [Dyadobacter psychrophilus]|uniref:DNA-damage-inducible protein D n=1 Tax=Dyadobacter psychrophilus TaxID=651661 RepID=A0A1T5ED93_9BACT|nr:DNA damage-inducible protein D [Dyadobacter psychrophilus]SKB81770.1 DNA-damage-inducible protein D [Dyadobacter psychrophilus]
MKAVNQPSLFEGIRKTDDQGNEFWSARDLAKILEYTEYRYFKAVIERAKEACKNSDSSVSDHFGDLHEMIKLGKGAKRKSDNVKLSRYACYLIVQNADPAKEVVALGQTYFAVQTRLQELRQSEEYNNLPGENEKRIFLRSEVTRHNLLLADSARVAGVVEPIDYAVFQNHGYMGLYGGLDAKAIHEKKELKKSQHILDHMGSSELAANLFRTTQTDDKLRRENITGKQRANKTHFEVGQKVRQTIQELGGTMPEELPSVASVKKLVKENDTRPIRKK